MVITRKMILPLDYMDEDELNRLLSYFDLKKMRTEQEFWVQFEQIFIKARMKARTVIDVETGKEKIIPPRKYMKAGEKQLAVTLMDHYEFKTGKHIKPSSK